MSGGSWSYMFRHTESLADELRSSGDPLLITFGEMLARAAQAMHDVEWVDSGDSMAGAEVDAIRAALDDDLSILDKVHAWHHDINEESWEEVDGQIGWTQYAADILLEETAPLRRELGERLVVYANAFRAILRIAPRADAE